MAMSNARMFTLARRYKALDVDAKEIAKQRGTLKDKITAEMQRRTAKKVESDDGVTVTLTQSTSVIYHEDEIESDLTPAQWRRVTTRKLDFGKLTEMLQNGDLPADFLSERSHIQHNAAYPTITIKE